MFISVKEMAKYWNIAPSGVLHVGAHLAEEVVEYEKYSWLPAIWVEAQPELVKILELKLDTSKHTILEAAVWDEGGIDLDLHIASSSQSSSLLNLGTHLDLYPDIEFISQVKVTTKRLDEIISPEKMPNFINIDIQGAELQALIGLGPLIKLVDFIYVEVNKKEVYENCAKVNDLDDFLLNFGFNRKCTRWYLNQGWGDALYLRPTCSNRRNLRQRLASLVINCLFYIKQYPAVAKSLLLKKP